ncbi:trafficking protein particle complex subunit 11-like [Homalodisca vitripennis]|uniref:trafficking protein particle complex subunit 11-like n=1 Tax=Homalodisca vitripennis TaxID=197043 RepID=UPI001EEAC74A|nr:trafficking protein particle complex subunit 11-like [Homalodisca vitripennis]
MATLEDGLEFPSELCWLPQSLVGVAGLDTLNNAVHRIVWEALANSRRQDRSPVHFKLLGPVHEFPPMKPKRNSYEWYIPKGILKRNWMKKHLKEVPAVVAIFYDLDWDDPEWPEKKIECTSRVQSIRAALEGRHTRLGVVLIQHKAPAVAGEDVLAVDRAAALCAAADINPKCLFVLPHVDHLQGYVLRLENALYEMAQGYYQQEIRHVKSHREFLNKTTHQYLFVRHQYKMAFLNELKHDNRNSHVHYSTSYSNLLELRVNDTNSLEVKTVAGYINYKVCRLLFVLNQPRDAISQFRSFIENFRSRSGPPELIFQHHAWLAKQYCLFGELFEEAIRGGLPAVQTMHPGYYYELAARHAADRKAASLVLCQGVERYPANDPLAGLDSLEFYGQRPWRAGNLSAQPPDPIREMEGFVALQYNERHHINHSAIIISLLGNAITQYKNYRCPRMRRHLAIQMADEYYSSKDYGKALTLLTHMLWDYRAERWDSLISSLLTKALSCAYLTASVREYIDLSLEASAYFPTERREILFDNLLSVIQGCSPEPDVEEDQDVTAAKALWTSKCATLSTLSHTVDMTNISTCVDCKARLVQESCTTVDIQVLVRCRFVKPVQFTRLTVCVNSPALSSEFAMCDSASDSPKLLFSPGEVKSFLCQITPDPADAGKEIQIGSILLELSSGKGVKVILRFTGNDSSKNSPLELRCGTPADVQFEKFSPAVVLALAHPVAEMDIKVRHEGPALQGSWHRLSACLTNPEPGRISQILLHVTIRSSLEDPSVEQKTDMCETVAGGLMSLPLSLTVEDMEPGVTVEKHFFMKPHSLTPRHLNIFVTYTSSKGEHCTQAVTETVEVSKALEVKFAFVSTHCEPVTRLYAREPFLLTPQIDCLSPSPLIIQRTELQLASEVVLQQTTYQCQLAGATLREGEGGTCITCLMVKQSSEQPFSLGNFVIHWNREGGEVSTLVVAMPTVTVENCPLQLEMCVPAHGWVRTPLSIAYLVHNHTDSLLPVGLNMEPSEAFMFSGHKQMRVSLLPQSHQKFEYNLYPLLSGLVALPQLKLSIPSDVATPQLVTELIDRAIPSHVYIMPQAKSRTTAAPTPA